MHLLGEAPVPWPPPKPCITPCPCFPARTGGVLPTPPHSRPCHPCPGTLPPRSHSTCLPQGASQSLGLLPGLQGDEGEQEAALWPVPNPLPHPCPADPRIRIIAGMSGPARPPQSQLCRVSTALFLALQLADPQTFLEWVWVPAVKSNPSAAPAGLGERGREARLWGGGMGEALRGGSRAEWDQALQAPHPL